MRAGGYFLFSPPGGEAPGARTFVGVNPFTNTGSDPPLLAPTNNNAGITVMLPDIVAFSVWIKNKTPCNPTRSYFADFRYRCLLLAHQTYMPEA